MSLSCPYCLVKSDGAEKHSNVVRFGTFYRKSDSRTLQRLKCLICKKGFSNATAHPCYRQNKRQVNDMLRKLLCSGVSQRRAAQILNVSRRTVVKKLLFLANMAELILTEMNKNKPQSQVIEFDDLETFEHTKCKPLSVTLAVESKTRHILGFEVSQMPAKGRLVHIARKKYGPRKDKRAQGRKSLFKKISEFVKPDALVKSDENPHYGPDVLLFFPKAKHETHKGRRGCIVGQGELKKIGFDPLFSLNHTCAKLRADINRLFRRTWCTTKKPERLAAHLAMYVVFHNQRLA